MKKGLNKIMLILYRVHIVQTEFLPLYHYVHSQLTPVLY